MIPPPYSSPLKGEDKRRGAQIKRLALEMGFDQVGITRVQNLEQGEVALQEWVAEGRHGTMKYLENFPARRENFFRDFQDAKSVIVLGVNYYSGAPGHNNGGEMKGRVARYAWGKDYHEVIRQKHQALIVRLSENEGEAFQAKSCVDIQPIPERWAASTAGLGFLGKHTVLLSAKFGPWLFLSEIVTNLELEEDLPAEGDCGTCDYCQKVCPTGALDKDYNMDARLCIAYLTIEHKGIIPRELRPKIKDWVFGCDECLNVCPFGSKSKQTAWPEFQPEAGMGPAMNIAELFEISNNKSYEEKFAGSAMLRAGRKQMLRNACIVMGNSGREEVIPHLEKALSDSSPLVRLHAAWALGELKFARAEKFLKEKISSEKDPEVLEEIRFSLGRFAS